MYNNNKQNNMSKTKEQLDIENEKNLILEELDYFYNKEKDLMQNISDVMELRQDLIDGIKSDLKKLTDLYSVRDEITDKEWEQCKEDKLIEEADDAIKSELEGLDSEDKD